MLKAINILFTRHSRATGTNDKERELYEKIIGRQQEEIDYLKGLVNVLK